MAGVIVQINGSSRLTFFVTGLVTTTGAFAWALLVRRVEPIQWDSSICASGK
jgi:hypothetical protein